MGFYERIVKYLANNDVVHLPLRMGGDKESINMIFNSWHDFVLVKRLLNKKNVLIVGPGESILRYKKSLEKFVIKNNIRGIISINDFIKECFSFILLFF